MTLFNFSKGLLLSSSLVLAACGGGGDSKAVSKDQAVQGFTDSVNRAINANLASAQTFAESAEVNSLQRAAFGKSIINLPEQASTRSSTQPLFRVETFVDTNNMTESNGQYTGKLVTSSFCLDAEDYQGCAEFVNQFTVVFKPTSKTTGAVDINFSANKLFGFSYENAPERVAFAVNLGGVKALQDYVGSFTDVTLADNQMAGEIEVAATIFNDNHVRNSLSITEDITLMSNSEGVNLGKANDLIAVEMNGATEIMKVDVHMANWAGSFDIELESGGTSDLSFALDAFDLALILDNQKEELSLTNTGTGESGLKVQLENKTLDLFTFVMAPLNLTAKSETVATYGDVAAYELLSDLDIQAAWDDISNTYGVLAQDSGAATVAAEAGTIIDLFQDFTVDESGRVRVGSITLTDTESGVTETETFNAGELF